MRTDRHRRSTRGDLQSAVGPGEQVSRADAPILGLDQVVAVLGHVEIDQRHRVPRQFELDVLAVLGTLAGDEQVDSGIPAGVAAYEVGVHVELAEVLQTDGSHDLQLHRHRRTDQLGRDLRRQCPDSARFSSL